MLNFEQHDEMVRSLLSEKALAMIDGLPSLLALDDLESLQKEIVEAHDKHAEAIQVIEKFLQLPEHLQAQDKRDEALRWEYLARRTFQAYQTEIMVREAEASVGVH